MILYRWLRIAIDSIFPPHKDAVLVRSVTDEDMAHLITICHDDDLYTLSDYTSKFIRALIHEAKFRNNKKAHMLLGILFRDFIHTYEKPLDIIIPIPLSTTRMRARGYNQVVEILTTHHALRGIRLRTDVLKRARDTQPQTELTRKERLHNLDNAFVVSKPDQVTGKHIMLVDDVMTTGSTFHAAKAALKKHSPASITCVAIAH